MGSLWRGIRIIAPVACKTAVSGVFEDFDIAQELKNFYHTFFYYELSDQQAHMILNYETPKLE